MISIVIPLYNKQHSVCSALQSVFRQTFDDYEVIVIDDGSTDASAQMVRDNFSDSRLRIISLQNAGVSAARNRGIAEAKGEYVAFLDADDKWKPDYLATQMVLAEKYPHCTVFAVNYEFQNKKGEISPTIIRKLPFSGADGVLTNYFEVAACSHPPLWTSAVIVHKEAIQSIGGFPVGIKSGEDLLTWARLACRYEIAYCIEPLAVFNVEGYEIKERPKRIPAQDDIVGKELRKLKDDYRSPHISDYIAVWHKMRSSVYMRLRMRKESIREAAKGLRFNPLNLKLYAYMLLNLLPSRLQPF